MNDAGMTCDVLVMGAGPGGIAAAVTAAEAGSRVLLVDDNPHAGGQIWRNQGKPPKHRNAARWITRLSQARNVTHLPASRIVAPLSSDALLAETPHGSQRLKFKSLILATGARELFLPFPGWTLPGVMGAGAIQALVKSGLQVRGKRILVAGTGPLLLAVAALLQSHGAIVPTIIEQAPAAKLRRFAFSLIHSPSKLLGAASMRFGMIGTTYSTDSYVTRASLNDSSLRIQIRRGSHDSTFACDYLACGFNLIPNNELPRILGCALTAEGFVQVNDQLQTTLPTTYAIGELTGIGGVDKAILEGRIAALSAVGNNSAAAALARQHAKWRSFVRRLDETFSLRPEFLTLAEPETLICRCEDVPLSAVAQSLGARDAKLQTRCGMGPCQGRVCGPILQRLVKSEAQIVRPPLFPTSIATLTGNNLSQSPKPS
jgi:D-hydroxyproline dehydrogenase subunit alpha